MKEYIVVNLVLIDSKSLAQSPSSESYGRAFNMPSKNPKKIFRMEINSVISSVVVSISLPSAV